MRSKWRVYLKDARTGEELASGIWHASGRYVNGDKGTMEDVVITPIGATPKDIGEQAYQGEYGFPAYCRCLKAEHFPGRDVVVKVWLGGHGTTDERRLK